MRIDVAAAAINFESALAGFESWMHWVANVPLGITKPPRGNAEPEILFPASKGGRTEPREIASMGSSGCESNQRPSQPLLMCFSGDAVCHFAIEEKCE